MTKIDIISGFLGAGKTTLIRRLLAEALQGEQVVLIENEFGEIGIDGGFLKEAGVQITEMNSGCICCTLVGDFGRALREVIEQYHPDRILIEPSGVGKLSDVINAVQNVAKDADVVLNSFVTVADAQKVKMYAKNFGEFYLNQIESAGAIILSRTQSVKPERLEQAVALLREHNADVRIVTTPWDELTGAQLLSVMEDSHSMAEELLHEMEEHHHHHEHEHHHHDHDHHEHHHEHDEHCTCGCHDHEHEHHHDHEHHHHDHDHHEHDEHCTCGCHDHDHHHHHHHADEVFMNWGVETARKYTEDEIRAMLTAMGDITLGTVLRAKGIVPAADGGWIHFDFVPGEPEIRRGSADYTGRLCVIGCDLDTERLAEVFEV
ncbi:MAG: GTP-binding protein [Butyricicoccus sp.]|nr:GTP-binding protein [Butyricicoccus sp.]MBQ8585104.1 GTP-binding protein [Butyricicoccus sp.]